MLFFSPSKTSNLDTEKKMWFLALCLFKGHHRGFIDYMSLHSTPTLASNCGTPGESRAEGGRCASQLINREQVLKGGSRVFYTVKSHLHPHKGGPSPAPKKGTLGELSLLSLTTLGSKSFVRIPPVSHRANPVGEEGGAGERQGKLDRIPLCTQPML